MRFIFFDWNMNGDDGFNNYVLWPQEESDNLSDKFLMKTRKYS